MAWANSQRKQRINKSGWQQQSDAKRIMRAHYAVCHWCGKPGANEVDHVVALANGGTDTDENKRPIHSRPCHIEKTIADRRTRKRPRESHPGLRGGG